MEKQDVKILFRFFSNLLDEWTVETMWAETINSEEGLYRLSNIPFYASVSCDDIVFAEYDQDEEILTYRKTIEHSGNSTIQVIVVNKEILANDLREIFNAFGCESEKFNDGYFVIEIPAKLDYTPIRQKLIELEEKNLINYAEPNLSNNHFYD
ncbi:DUF4265 domain-containing protein [Flavobacterium undicola]|uniref:DUF4265 domain-containing protein n=1 Tax=Flavobacterium undicola TaxID=1932779 RepID=UPI001378E469|nr:DUF4265 domain-containing protein [Flavobacterium undicola]MBA0882233.1 DUF4265 domain-containing protein [Flavobacterium undicola]